MNRYLPTVGFVQTSDAALRSPCVVGRGPARPEATLRFGSVERGVGVSGAKPLTMIGFTAPSGTYDRMRALQGDVLRLNASIEAGLPVSDPFVAAWRAWRATWTPFYEKYAGPDAGTWTKLGAAFRSDELAADVDRFDAQYRSFLAEYTSLRTPGGQPLPGLPPAIPPVVEPGMPWWFWAGTGAAVTGLGVLAYRRFGPKPEGR